MNVFDLFAKLSLDTDDYDSKLDKAKSAGASLGSGLASAAKIGISAVGAAAGATVAFGASSVKAGAEFDKSMSQVAATMGKTVNEIEDLRDFAQDMGRTTAFSATQAADALNYMALAGYDADTSMSMLPNVLNLAAAGNMDLARASDMVTDTQTAFGISLERTSQMVDEMAKAASTGNTSVEQLGDAFLTVGGLAAELNGGMITLDDGTVRAVDGVQELEIALTAMANAGVKGSEAGTHMRNMLLKLSSPSAEGTKALEAMGVAVFNAEGNMRSLSDVFGDLSGALNKMTQEQKIQTISDLFNTRDLASAEALLNAVGEDWDSIGESILNAQYSLSDVSDAIQNASIDWTKYLETPWLKSAETMGDAWSSLGEQIAYNLQTQRLTVEETADFISNEYDMSMEDALAAVTSVSDALGDMKGAASKMADTQLDNLAGDVTLFQSALEGAKIAISDGLTPMLREFVEFGTEGLSRITEAFKEDGVSGAMEAFGEILSEGLNMLFENLPAIIDAGMMLLEALGQGIMNNLPLLIDASIQIITMLGNGFIQALPEIVKAAVQIIGALGSALIDQLPIILPQIIQLVVDLALYLANNADKLVSGVITLVTTIAQIMIENLPLILSAVVEIVIALGKALIDNIPLLISSVEQIFWQLVDLIAEYGGKMMADVWNWLVDLAQNVWQGMKDMFDKVVEWLSQLPSEMAYWIGYAVGKFIDGIIHLPEKLKKIFDAVIDKVLSFGKDFKDNAQKSAKDFFDNLVNGIKELPARMVQFAKDLLDAVASLPEDFMNVGSNIVTGIWNGISAGWDWLVSSVKNLASSLLQGAKDALGIASPSKEFAWVGKMVDEGFAKGINDNADMVTSAMDAITDVSDVVNDIDVAGTSVSAGAGTYIINVNQPVATPSEMADAIRLESQYGLILGGGLLA